MLGQRLRRWQLAHCYRCSSSLGLSCDLHKLYGFPIGMVLLQTIQFSLHEGIEASEIKVGGMKHFQCCQF